MSAVSGAGPPTGRGPPADVVVPDDYSTIQAGIDAADPGGTVLVGGGTYREQVLIDKDLELTGRNGATIEAADSLATYTIVESGSTWAPMVFAYGGQLDGGEVSGSSTVGVDVSGFEFDGRGDTGQAGRKTALLCRNVSGASPSVVADNTITEMGAPGGTLGIVAYGGSDLRIEGNELSGFGRGGIGANGDGGQHPSPNVVVHSNRIDAGAGVGGSAPNGVQIGYGATGQVRNNTVENCRYAEDTDGLWQASGILVFESDGVTLRGNTLRHNDVAAAVSAWGWFRGSASHCTVVANRIEDALIGVNLRATAWDQDGGLAALTNRDPSVNDTKVVNNGIEDTDGEPAGEAGIAVESNDRGDDEFDPEVSNNKLIRNSVTGFESQVTDEGTDTKVQAIEP